MDRLVAEALAREGLAVLAHERISPFDGALARRHAYRVTLADGRTIKARRTLGEAEARRVFEVLRALGHDRFARVLSRHGAVLLEEWVEGITLSSATLPPAQVLEAAGLLAELHGVDTADGGPVRGEGSTEVRLRRTEACLARLADAGALSRREAAALGATLRRLDPRRAGTGFVHLDFCPENMVIDAGGRLRVIDNESMAVDAYAYDLARAWYRAAWPPAEWARFEEEYRRRGGPGAAGGAPLFWRIAAVAEGALARWEADPARAHAPLERLRELAAEPRAPSPT
jgi:aminoglycoside phosphotransferase (APT) family kinase protein